MQAGARRPVRLQDPAKPSAEEISERTMTHLPFRSWCCHSVRGKGRSMDHRKVRDGRGLPEIHVDYCFMGTSEEDGVRTIVVAKHAESRAVTSSIVPVKGAAHEFPAKRIKAFVRELGLEHCKVVLKSDQEPALLDLLNEVARLRAPAQTIPEQSPARSSASNGRVERGTQAVEGQIRVMKDALEFRIKESVPGNHSVMAWLVEYAGVLINWYEVGA